MSDVKLASLQSSALQRTLNSVSKSDPFVYSLNQSAPPSAGELIKISPDSSVSATGNQTLTWRLPSNGFLVDGYLNLTQTYGPNPVEAGNTSANAPGLYAYEYLSLSTRDVEIAKFNPMALHYDMLNHKNSKQFMVATLADLHKGPTNAAAQTRSVYTPFGLLPFCSRPSDSLDCTFLEDMFFNAKVRSVTDWKNVDAGANTIDSANLVLKYQKLNSDDYQQYVDNNYSQDKSLTKLVWSHYTENPVNNTDGAGSHTVTVNIDCPAYAIQTYVGVRNAKGKTGVAGSGGATEYYPITDIKFSANGKDIVETFDDMDGYELALQSKFEKKGDEEDVVPRLAAVADGKRVVEDGPHNIACVDYRLLNNLKSDVSNEVANVEGGVSMGALSSKQMTIKYTKASASTDSEIVVVHKILNMVSVNGTNGSMSVSTRS